MKKLLALMSATFLFSGTVTTTVSCSLFNNDELDKLLNFREIDYNNIDNLPVLRNMQDDVLMFRGQYFKDIQAKFKKQYNDYYNQLLNKNVLSVDMTENTSVGDKSQLLDSVYLGQQAFGYYYPTATELHEINRYEIPNFGKLTAAGYTLYINNSNQTDLEIVNLDKTKDSVDFDNKTYQPLTNTNQTDCVYFKTTDRITSTNASGGSTWSFIAVKDGDLNNVIITKPNDYGNTTLSVSIVGSNPEKDKTYIQYKMGDWLRYNFVNNAKVQAYELTTVLLTYIEMVGNYMTLLERIQIDPGSVDYTDLLNGFGNLLNGDFDGVSPAASLYVTVKYGFNFEMFTIMQDDGETVINFILDQNTGLNQPIESDLKALDVSELKREQLDFNPYILLNPKIIAFARHVWNLLFKLEDLQIEKLKEIGRYD